MSRLFQMGTTVGGIPASQTPSALFWYEQIIHAHGIQGILELGTERGGLSVFFGLQCPHHTVTVDVTDQLESHTRFMLTTLGVRQEIADCRDEEVARRLIYWVQRPLLVFCDNGYKKDEFGRYAPLLFAGDLIGVHDCGTEFHPDADDTKAVVAANHLERIYQAELDEDRTIAAFWRRL